MFETLRGGSLMLVRWLVLYPVVHLTYRVRGWTRAPFNMERELEGKPGILVSNYGNYLYDDMIGMMVSPVWPFAFARASGWQLPFLQSVLRVFRVLSVAPREQREENERMFAHLVQLLRQGHWLSVFPEKVPGDHPRLSTPLKPGAAHVALRAEDAAGWGLGLRIYVYGTNYENKFAGRSNVFVRWASPIVVARYRETYSRSPLEAERTLMREIERELRGAVLEADGSSQLSDAYRLAFQRGQPGFAGVQDALTEVMTQNTVLEPSRKIVRRKGSGSLLYQALGFGLFAVGAVVGWPFRVFGKLCAADPSQEMTYQFVLWMLVLLTGALVSDWHWASAQAFGSWGSMAIWMWAWRRGIVAG